MSHRTLHAYLIAGAAALAFAAPATAQEGRTGGGPPLRRRCQLSAAREPSLDSTSPMAASP